MPWEQLRIEPEKNGIGWVVTLETISRETIREIGTLIKILMTWSRWKGNPCRYLGKNVVDRKKASAKAQVGTDLERLKTSEKPMWLWWPSRSVGRWNERVKKVSNHTGIMVPGRFWVLY